MQRFSSVFSWAVAGSIIPTRFLTDIYLICFLSTSVREIPEIPLSICSLFNYPSCKGSIFLSSESNCFCCYQYSRLLKQMVFQTPAIHNPFLFRGFDEPMLIAQKFEKNQTERSFVTEVNKYLNHILNRVLSQVLGNSLESIGEELPVGAFIKKTKPRNAQNPTSTKTTNFLQALAHLQP